ncbi:MAG: hypothetical protein QOG63_2017, partial [Thermoleophilaceae bacterium]|nr:hypothetical protein [Thermoleophilaceae bacterium]
MRLTRRSLLRAAAGTAAAGLMGCGGSARPQLALPRLERGLAFGPFFAGNPDQRYESNRS